MRWRAPAPMKIVAHPLFSGESHELGPLHGRRVPRNHAKIVRVPPMPFIGLNKLPNTAILRLTNTRVRKPLCFSHGDEGRVPCWDRGGVECLEHLEQTKPKNRNTEKRIIFA